MTDAMKFAGALSLVVALAGCQDPTGGAPAAGNSAEAAARQACLQAVAQSTGNPTVTVLRSSFSEAGTEVIVGVGEQRAQWRCIGYRDGTTTGITSLTDEGAL